MSKNSSPLHPAAGPDHPSLRYGKTGVLLVALGTPDAPTYWPVRRYLAEFLSDSRVIEVPKPLWLPILYGPILTFRSAKSARAYAKIWDYERGESPLRTITRDQSAALQATLGDDIVVDWAFRYGAPSIEDRLSAMKEAGCDRILVAALYPHYSATTTASVYDKVFDVLKTMRWQPTLRTLPPYHDHPAYIAALADSARTSLEDLDWKPDAVLASYHSIPQAYWDKGDPYPCQCQKTSRLLGDALGKEPDFLHTSFQSRVGPTKWVGPYTDHYTEQLAAEKGVKKLAVMAPGFSSDCLETLEEINMELRETFLEAGGTHFHYIPCLNASEAGMDVLATVIGENLAGWGI